MNEKSEIEREHDNAGFKPTTISLTTENICDAILKANTALDNAEVPETDRVLLVTPDTGAMDIARTQGTNTAGQASENVSGTPLGSYDANNFASYKYMEFACQSLSGIEITTQPSKTAYTVGESFNPAGMVVTARIYAYCPGE